MPKCSKGRSPPHAKYRLLVPAQARLCVFNWVRRCAVGVFQLGVNVFDMSVAQSPTRLGAVAHSFLHAAMDHGGNELIRGRDVWEDEKVAVTVPDDPL